VAQSRRKTMAKRPSKKTGDDSSPQEALLAKAQRDKQLDEPEAEVLELFDDGDDDDQAMFDQLEEIGIDLVNETGEADHFVVADDEELEELEEEGFEEERFDGAALADDPVRMYLKEIGQVQLLDPNRETWLSSQMAAVTLLDLATKHATNGQPPTNVDILAALYEHLLLFWREVVTRAATYHIELPDLPVLLHEAQALRRNWNAEPPSYIRTYLERGEWGRDENWTALARSLFEVFQALYLVPTGLQDKLRE